MNEYVNLNDKISLSIILPAYNEQDNLETVIKSVSDVIISVTDDFEIIIIDDGSTDETGEIAEALSRYPNVKFFQHKINLGMGKAIKTGISNARFPVIMDIPCDHQFNSRDILKFVDKIKTADIVVGYRLNKVRSFRRKIYSDFNLMLLNLFFGLKLKDPTWVKMFRRSVFDEVKLESEGFFWETEVLVKAKARGLKIEEVPTYMQPRLTGISKGNNILRAMDVFFSILGFWLRYKIFKLKK